MNPQSRLAKKSFVEVDRATRSLVSEAYGKTALSFQANHGQTDPKVKFLARASGYNLFLTPTEAVLALRIADRTVRNADSLVANYKPPDPQSAYIKMKLVGANPSPCLSGLDPLPGASNYFVGARNWQTGIPSYERVKYGSVYPGIDMIFYGNQRDLEYDFKVAPGADPAAIRVSFEAPRSSLRLDGRGDLIIETATGQIRQRKPFAYQEVDGAKKQVAARYVLKGSRAGFHLGSYDKSKPLIIDPVLTYSTYLGGSGSETGWAIAVDSEGNAYIAGESTSLNFPVSPGSVLINAGGSGDVFVIKLNPTGRSLLYSSFIGGTGFDTGFGIAVDDEGNAYVTGFTMSSNFPLTPGAFQAQITDIFNAFVFKLNPAGDALVYSTYLGGTSIDTAKAVAVDSEGAAYVTGETTSPNFPLVNPIQSRLRVEPACIFGDAIGSCSDAFVTKLNSAGTALVYSTYLGGEATDTGTGIAVDPEGAAFVTGVTASTDFATTGEAFQKQSGGTRTGGGFGGDAFVTKIAPSGSSFVYSTYLGAGGDEKGAGIAVDSEGNAYVVGTTDSFNFPTTAAAAQPSNGGSAAYKSTTGGSNWNGLKNGLAADNIKALAIDPVNPSTIYAGAATTDPLTPTPSPVPGGVFKSTDGGNSWVRRSEGVIAKDVNAIAVDPDTPSTVYAGTSQGVFKSTDGGNSWVRRSDGLELILVNALVIDPKRPSTIYAGTGVFSGPPGPPGLGRGGIFKSMNGGLNWGPTAFNEGSNNRAVVSLAIDPRKSQMLYAGTSVGFFRGLKGGKKWKGPSLAPIQPNFTATAINSIAIDPNNRSTIYVAQGSINSFTSINGGFFKSTDRGVTWGAPTSGINVSIPKAIAVDPRSSSTLYAGGYSTIISTFGNPQSGALLKSTNGGSSWAATELSDVLINAIAIDPQNSSVYAGTFIGSDAFITKIDTAGSKLLYSTYLGGRGADLGFAIAVDWAGAAYVTGHTVSDRFPLKDAFQTTKGRADSIGDAFVAALNPAGSALIYSSYLGGNGIDEAFAIGVDSSGAAYVTGRNNSLNFPTVNPFQAALTGSVFDAFVTKVAPAQSP